MTARPDGTADRLQAERPDVFVVRQDNTERGAARNHGLRIATGRFVAFLDSDDVLEPWYVSQFADRWETLARSDRVYVCPFSEWYPSTGSTRSQPLERQTRSGVLPAAIRQTQWGPACVIVPRATALSFGGFPGGPCRRRKRRLGVSDPRGRDRYGGRGAAAGRRPAPYHPGRSVNDDEARIAGRQAALAVLPRRHAV